MKMTLIRALFVVAGLYDGILGLAFIVAPYDIFAFFAVEPPNHVAYVQFPALLLLIFAWLFFLVASDPLRYRHLIPFGWGLKVSYSGLAFYHEWTTGIPAMWIPWAWADLVFLVLFIAAWASLKRA